MLLLQMATCSMLHERSPALPWQHTVYHINRTLTLALGHLSGPSTIHVTNETWVASESISHVTLVVTGSLWSVITRRPGVNDLISDSTNHIELVGVIYIG